MKNKISIIIILIMAVAIGVLTYKLVTIESNILIDTALCSDIFILLLEFLLIVSQIHVILINGNP